MPLNVLICDDSGFARKQLARALPSDWNVNIHFAGNGQEGLEQILSGHGDLVFLDLTMPVMDGYQVLQAIKDEALKTKVIVVSGDIQPEAHAQVMQLGALSFIKKPCSADEIASLLTQT
jgi:CheY-like chemotaxis protein